MHRLSSAGLASLLLVGLLGAGCGGESQQPDTPPVLTEPTVTASEVSAGAAVTLAIAASALDGDKIEVAKPRPVNHDPVVTAGPSASRDTAMANQSVSLSVSASDPDGDPLFYTWSQEPAAPAGSFSSTSVANPTWTSPSVTAETTFQLQVRIADGKGGEVSRSVAVVVLAPVSGPTTTATSRGCTFTITAQAKPGTLPPQYDYIVARQASTSCSHAAATTTVGTSYTSQASITGNFLGIAVAYTTKNTASGSSPVSVYVKQLAPDTLSTVRQAMLTCGPSIYSVGYSNLFIPDGTTVQVDGSKGCTLYGYTETGSGSNYRASFYDFFTTTNPPTVVAY